MIEDRRKRKPEEKRYRGLASYFGAARTGEFGLGERVRVGRPLRNDGTYPHKDLGEILVRAGDVGFVLEINRFRSDTYYTVEFVERSVVMAARAADLERLTATAVSVR